MMKEHVSENVPYGWSEDRQGFLFVIRPVCELIQRYVGAPGTVRVLDLGCGNGALCGALRALGYDVSGTEVDQEGCTLARKRNKDVPIFQVGVYDSPDDVLENGPYDCVVSTEVIEHLYAPKALPNFAARVLRPGGWLIISAPYHGYLKNLVWSIFNFWDRHHAALWEGGHIKFFSRKTLSQLLEAVGFEVVAFRGVRRLPFLWSSMILVVKKQE
jgi:2-polyprenyl-3-methyl-5-hydroxy-6-metoxy-1,4-benzoquinol methylase